MGLRSEGSFGVCVYLYVCDFIALFQFENLLVRESIFLASVVVISVVAESEPFAKLCKELFHARAEANDTQ